VAEASSKRDWARRLLGERLTRELHARRWARAMPRFSAPSERPFELALVDRFLGGGDIALDFGAHGGAWSYPMARRVGPHGRVHAFEIFPYYSATLKRALMLADVENVVLHRCGVGETSGEIEIVLIDEQGTSLTGMIRTRGPNEEPRKTETVPIRTFDSLCEEEPELLRARFAKIDVEGSEFALFKGGSRLLREVRPVIFCEVTKRQCARNGHTRREVLEFVRSAHYGLYVYEKSGAVEAITPETADLPGDFLFVPSERTLEVVGQAR
jgi:FkbM family methyltransferase